MGLGGSVMTPHPTITEELVTAQSLRFCQSVDALPDITILEEPCACVIGRERRAGA